jgi:hypothetical protein
VNHEAIEMMLVAQERGGLVDASVGHGCRTRARHDEVLCSAPGRSSRCSRDLAERPEVCTSRIDRGRRESSRQPTRGHVQPIDEDGLHEMSAQRDTS